MNGVSGMDKEEGVGTESMGSRENIRRSNLTGEEDLWYNLLMTMENPRKL